jgi:hypothetical protein
MSIGHKLYDGEWEVLEKYLYSIGNKLDYILFLIEHIGNKLDYILFPIEHIGNKLDYIFNTYRNILQKLSTLL